MGGLYQSFYSAHEGQSLAELRACFAETVADFLLWVNAISDEALFSPGGRKWAASTPSGWPVWKWVHMNSVAPFKSFRSKIRKWKKLRAAQ